jgi:hypothetical protein
LLLAHFTHILNSNAAGIMAAVPPEHLPSFRLQLLRRKRLPIGRAFCACWLVAVPMPFPKFVLGGDRVAEEGKPLMRVGDVLTGEDTFTIIAHSMEEVTKIKALRTPQIMEACFGNEECIKRVIAKREEEEKMKTDKKSIGNEEFKRKMIELLKGSDDEETNTNNGGGSGEEDQDHFGEALWWHSSSKTKLRP